MTTHGSATNLQAVYPSSGLNARADDQSTPGLTRSGRSEEHTSELQSQSNLVCRLLLEKKKKHVLVGDKAASTLTRCSCGHPAPDALRPTPIDQAPRSVLAGLLDGGLAGRLTDPLAHAT